MFLGRALKAPQVRRVDRASKSKVVHVIHIRHGTRLRRRSPTGFKKRRVDHEENNHDENHEENREEASKEIEATLVRPTELYCAPLEVTKSMAKLSRRELARMASGMAAASSVRLRAQNPAPVRI